MDQTEIDGLWSRVPHDMREGLESRFRPQDEPEEALTLSAWLSARGLSRFESGLVDLGLEGVDDLKLVEREDLEILGLSIEQIAAFFGESPQPPDDTSDAAATPVEETLQAWLDARGLAQFESKLADLGVEGLEDLSLIERDDLQVLGFNSSQIAVFLGESEPDQKDAAMSTSKDKSRTVAPAKVAASGKRVIKKGSSSRRSRTLGFMPKQVPDASDTHADSPALGAKALDILMNGSS